MMVKGLLPAGCRLLHDGRVASQSLWLEPCRQGTPSSLDLSHVISFVALKNIVLVKSHCADSMTKIVFALKTQSPAILERPMNSFILSMSLLDTVFISMVYKS